jgi:hypothetical protein
MSLYFGHWLVLAADATGNFTCRCVCGTVMVVESGAPDESLTCRSCGYQPLAPQHRDDLRAEQARQLEFRW